MVDYYPIEVCDILPDQRVALKKQNEEQMQKMIKVCCNNLELRERDFCTRRIFAKAASKAPAERIRQIGQIVDKTELVENKFLTGHGVGIEREPVKTTARILPKPTIQYAKGVSQSFTLSLWLLRL